jgi:hypothetical protein
LLQVHVLVGMLMTLSKCAKLGLQVQSVVARVNFPHERNSVTKEWQMGPRHSPTWFSAQVGCLRKGFRGLSR